MKGESLSLQTGKDSLTHSLRQKTMEVAKRHKASWVELGRYLQTVFKDKYYREWGFLSFEAYCVKELGIKPATASKLLKSYAFLEKEKPVLADAESSESAGVRNFPSYEAVNLLRLAKANKNLTENDYADFKEALLETGKEPREVRRQMKETLSARQEKDTREAKLARRNSLIKRLVSLLSSARRECENDKLLPGFLLREIEELARKLEAQIE